MKLKIFGYVVVSVILGFAILIAARSTNIPEGDNNTPAFAREAKPPIIDPTPFKVGYIKDSPQKLANLCKDDYNDVVKSGDFWNASYPINPVYVNYGDKHIPSDCECLEFIKAP